MSNPSETKKGAYIVTYSGIEINLEFPHSADIDYTDVAHALSYIYRFTGHGSPGWSVGQHSIVGSIMAEVLYPEHPDLKSQFMLHDATEAYLGDVSAPLNSLLSEYRVLEARHQAALETVSGLSLSGPFVKLLDQRMLATERRLFMPYGSNLWKGDFPPFGYAEFEAGFHKNIINAGNNPGEFWDWLWLPWSPSDTETLFHDRLDLLGI